MRIVFTVRELTLLHQCVHREAPQYPVGEGEGLELVDLEGRLASIIEGEDEDNELESKERE